MLIAFWCRNDNTIFCSLEETTLCTQDGWKENNNTFSFEKNVFESDSITFECSTTKDIMINVVLFQKYTINIPNSIISFNVGDDSDLQSFFNQQNKITSYFFEDLTSPMIASSFIKTSLKGCIDNCEDCNGTDSEICITCQSGFFLNENQTCSSCEELNCVASSDTCDRQTGNCSKLI
ncbi:hypothetical protein QTN25_004936 [Entamoeba marina]